jgi:hypothetical protein
MQYFIIQTETTKLLAHIPKFMLVNKNKLSTPMKSAIFWDVMLCGSCKNQSFRGT